ncbi:kinase-like protein [Ramicandelaber brevisporus]|nr:kinase-like protein [Ramicandelaber brevisporus]
MNRFSRYEIDGIESSGYRRVVIDEIKDLLLRLHGIYDRNIPRGVAFMFRELFKAGSLSEMKVPRIVASGRYADLWFSHTRIGESYGPWALKRFNEVNNEQQEYIMREAELMRALDGQEVVPRFVAYHWVDQRLKGLYMEWFERGSLYDAITDSTVSQRESWAIDLEKKLEHLHSLGVIHGDISPENILIANDDSIRFCDLHCSGEGRNCVGKERCVKDSTRAQPALNGWRFGIFNSQSAASA